MSKQPYQYRIYDEEEGQFHSDKFGDEVSFSELYNLFEWLRKEFEEFVVEGWSDTILRERFTIIKTQVIPYSLKSSINVVIDV